MISALTEGTTRELITPGTYHTDGVRLLRIEEAVGDDGSFYTVEDCRTLEVVILAVNELMALGLRPVPAPVIEPSP